MLYIRKGKKGIWEAYDEKGRYATGFTPKAAVSAYNSLYNKSELGFDMTKIFIDTEGVKKYD